VVSMARPAKFRELTDEEASGLLRSLLGHQPAVSSASSWTQITSSDPALLAIGTACLPNHSERGRGEISGAPK
jgi:hypothetical protein